MRLCDVQGQAAQEVSQLPILPPILCTHPPMALFLFGAQSVKSQAQGRPICTRSPCCP